MESMAYLNFWDTSEMMLSHVWLIEILVDINISCWMLSSSVTKFNFEKLLLQDYSIDVYISGILRWTWNFPIECTLWSHFGHKIDLLH